MDGLISFGNNRTYDDFKKQISVNVLPLVESLRNFCLSLDDKVIEDVRMHRIVFCKSLTFRWFADVEPQQDKVIVKIQKNRKELKEVFQVLPQESLDKLKQDIKNAFQSIR